MSVISEKVVVFNFNFLTRKITPQNVGVDNLTVKIPGWLGYHKHNISFIWPKVRALFNGLQSDLMQFE